jgi:hypothetical protein
MKWLGLLAGTMLMVIGGAAAIVIGPDDWLDSPPQLLNPDGEVAIVTNYGLLSSSLPLRVSAAADTGEAFVGIGHAVDVDDYVRDTKTVGIDWFSPSGLTSHRQDATSQLLPATPAEVDFWRVKAAGPGSQLVTGSFGGQPVEAMVSTNSGEPSALRVSIGSQLVGAFATSVSLIGLGIALMGFTTWRWRRARRALRLAESTPAAPDSGHPLRALRTATAVVLGFSLLWASSGCSAAEIGVGLMPVPPRAELTRDPLDGLNLAAFGPDYDRRNNPAITAAKAPRYSAKEWELADAELLLAADRFGTALNKGKKLKPAGTACQTSTKLAYHLPAKAYPLTVIANDTFTCGTPTSGTSLSVFSRARSFSPWLHVAAVGLGTRPAPLPGVNQPSPQDQKAASEASAELTKWIASGNTVGVEVTGAMKKWRAGLVAPWKWAKKSLSAEIITHGVRTVATDQGTITVVSVVTTKRLTAKKGSLIWWRQPYADLYQQRGQRTSLTQKVGFTAAISITGGKTHVIAWNSSDYLPD